MKIQATCLLLSLLSPLVTSSPVQAGQTVLSSTSPQPIQHVVDEKILSALEKYDDPLEALLYLKPELQAFMEEPRLLEVMGVGEVWMTEGDKIRLRKEGKNFIDLTGHQHRTAALDVDSPYLPNITHQRWIRPAFADISKQEMHDNLKHLTSYFNRYYFSINGEKSARWIHDYLSKIISKSPVQTYISLEYHTNTFPQPSIIARFEPAHRNASLPLTIIGAHQDSANYLFPLLPAPGADDDCSGTVTILEAFRVLAMRGFIPQRGPVEFHWYAAEEAGLFGSLAIAGYKKDQGAKVGAMLEFDMTAYVHRNATESMYFVSTQADPDLTKWCAGVAKEYSDLKVEIEELGPLAGSDYMAWTKYGYPAAFATEGNPLARGGFPGDFDPYVHSDKDRMDINDDQGYFSIDHMTKFTEVAIAFIVEQAGWSLKHTRAGDGEGSVMYID